MQRGDRHAHRTAFVQPWSEIMNFCLEMKPEVELDPPNPQQEKSASSSCQQDRKSEGFICVCLFVGLFVFLPDLFWIKY